MFTAASVVFYAASWSYNYKVHADREQELSRTRIALAKEKTSGHTLVSYVESLRQPAGAEAFQSSLSRQLYT
jgi:hypothetical protein